MFGAIDECFVDNGVYMPADYKTRGFGLKEDSTKYFQNQLNCYTFLLKTNGYKVNNKGYLIYYILKGLEEGGIAKFDIDIIEMKTYPDDAYDAFRRAVEMLGKPIPALNPDCSFCSWAKDNN
jgi:hypothetical protein